MLSFESMRSAVHSLVASGPPPLPAPLAASAKVAAPFGQAKGMKPELAAPPAAALVEDVAQQVSITAGGNQ